MYRAKSIGLCVDLSSYTTLLALSAQSARFYTAPQYSESLQANQLLYICAYNLLYEYYKDLLKITLDLFKVSHNDLYNENNAF